jgi:hypothetical protein
LLAASSSKLEKASSVSTLRKFISLVNRCGSYSIWSWSRWWSSRLLGTTAHASITWSSNKITSLRFTQNPKFTLLDSIH